MPATPPAASPQRGNLPDLTALGLPPSAALTLAVVADEGWTDAATVAGRTGLSRPAVTAALDVLAERGLVVRERGRRPVPVRLAHDVADVVAGLADLARDEATAAAGRARDAADAVRAAAARVQQRPPAPVRRWQPAVTGGDWALALPRRSYDVVAPPDSTAVRFGQHLERRWVERRLLVSGRLEPLRRAQLLAQGVALRETSAGLPALIVVDGDRAAVEVGADARGGQRGWTTDRPQVDALRRLFELWWQEATNGCEPAEAPEKFRRTN